ncbi:hypothetical protein KUW00_06550 [Halomonas sp. DP5N14-9]|uniref:hypothetical protein n=1 Tax=Halomonas sp. DP5N14-9 TaxID=2859075 RepID=UPI001C98FE0E|nr:hypothetical protein [Halomonas sp. DP5N14-9]MBY5940542.1 hypothetical protein [Halomonas sp. DP5N14-9]
MECIEATLEKLELERVPFPEWFVPRFFAKDEAEGFDGCWMVYDSKPHFTNGEWVSNGSSYEIGVDDSEGLAHTPSICRGLEPSRSLFRIVTNS